MTNSEMRPVDHAQFAQGIAAEAAQLAEHIRDTEPSYCRQELLDLLIELIDDGHEEAAKAQLGLEGGERS